MLHETSLEEARAPHRPAPEPVTADAAPSVGNGSALQQLVDAMPAQVAVVDAEWRILTANGAWIDAAGKHPRSALLMVGQSYRSFCEWALMSGVEAARATLDGLRAIDEGRTRQHLQTYRSATSAQYYHVSISRFEADGASYATISRLDMTELFELRRQRLRLSASLMRVQVSLVRAQEEERQRVARELHDTAAQYLVAMGLSIARLRELGCVGPAAGAADELSNLLDEFHRDLRGLTYVLHPPLLERSGLHAAIESLCRGFARRAGLDIVFSVHGTDRKSGSTVEAAVYRLVQEALSNIHRHARASHARIRLSDRPDALFVVIEDDGVGLPPAMDAREELSVLGVGIAGMFARVAELGGRLTIRNRIRARGTRVAAVVPRHGAGQTFLVDPILAALHQREADAGELPRLAG